MITKQLKAEVSELSGLSPKVRRIFELKAIGKTETEIAQLIYRSIKTVNTQAGTILDKLDCKNIQEAIAKASAEGWLTFKYISKNFIILVLLGGFTGQLLFSDNDIRRTRLTRSFRIAGRRITEDQV